MLENRHLSERDVYEEVDVKGNIRLYKECINLFYDYSLLFIIMLRRIGVEIAFGANTKEYNISARFWWILDISIKRFYLIIH